jgi:TonB-linked SusC/RagA family outer membrane protein
VTDVETGAPILSARVTVKGTNVGTYTGSDGRFTMNVPDGAITLDVRRIGYQPATQPVTADQNEVEIKLKADVLQLSQEVITGQATTVAKKNLATDVAVVNSADLTRTQSPTIENALQGKVPGAIITANSGAPGGGLQVRMRGVTSIFGNSDPLYVVDGLPVSNTTIQNGLNGITGSAGGVNSSSQDNGVNRIADLNPEDIASIEVLKGSSAAAIYGSQAANGVIVITTKRGQAGKPRFSFLQRLGTSEQSHKLGLRHFTLDEAYAYAGADLAPDKRTMDSAAVKANYDSCNGYCDFEDEVYGQHSLSYESSLNVSGGNDNTQYFISGLAKHENGIQIGTGASFQSLRANLNQLFGSKLELQVSTNFVHNLTRRGISNNDNVNITPYFVFGATPSFFDLRPKNGIYPKNPFLSNSSNPLQTVALVQTPEETYHFLGSVTAGYTFFNSETQNLKATLQLGLDQYTDRSNIYSPPALYWEPADGFPGTSTDQAATETRAPVALSLAHKYTPTSGSYSFTTSAGVRRGYDDLNTTNVVAQNLLGDQQNINRGAVVSAFQNRQNVRTLAFYGQEEVLLFNDRLYLSAGILGQRSTNNADVNKLYYFPKASASYRWAKLGPFDEFKLRFAYGETGNEPLYGQKFTALTGSVYDGLNAATIQGNVADPNLHPEREREFEGGIDLGLFNSRVALSATAYQKNNTDLLLQAQLATSTGYARRVFNGGEIRNRGIEASLQGFPIQAQSVTWLSRVTFSKNQGKVISIPVPAFTAPNAFAAIYGLGRIQAGESPSAVWGFNSDGVLAPLGDYEPDFVMGFSNEFTVGPVRLYGLFDWRHGGSVVNITQNLFDLFGTSPDQAAAAKRLDEFNNGITAYTQDASFVKLREVTLSYQLPASLVQRAFGARVSGVRAELSGRNLVTWTPYDGLDPEVSNFGNQNINRGQDLAPYPPTRSYMFTLAVDF